MAIPGKDSGGGSKLPALAVEFPGGDETGELPAYGRIGFVIRVKADKDVIRTGGIDEFVMRAADAAGGDRADGGPETDKSFSLKRAFSNYYIGARRQRVGIESKVNWSSGAGPLWFVRGGEPAILLGIVFGDVQRIQTKLAGLDVAMLVLVRNKEHGHAVVTRLPDMSKALGILPDAWDAD